jgi:hypothetical protein
MTLHKTFTATSNGNIMRNLPGYSTAVLSRNHRPHENWYSGAATVEPTPAAAHHLDPGDPDPATPRGRHRSQGGRRRPVEGPRHLGDRKRFQPFPRCQIISNKVNWVNWVNEHFMQRWCVLPIQIPGSQDPIYGYFTRLFEPFIMGAVMAFLKPSKFLTLSLCFRAFFKVLHALFTDFSFPLFCIELMGRWKHGGSDKKSWRRFMPKRALWQSSR